MHDAKLSREAIFKRTCTTLVLKGLNLLFCLLAHTNSLKMGGNLRVTPMRIASS